MTSTWRTCSAAKCCEVPIRTRSSGRSTSVRPNHCPGSKPCLTWEDVPDWRGGTPRNTRILDRKVRFVGDAVALVAATTEEIAAEALGLIQVDYEVLPAVFDPEEALKADAPQLYEAYPG